MTAPGRGGSSPTKLERVGRGVVEQQPEFGDARVLVAVGDRVERERLVRSLAVAGPVETLSQGDRVLARIRKGLPDLVIVDVATPGLDPGRLVHAIRRDPATQDIPVLLIAAPDDEERAFGGLQAGANDYLVKPVAPRLLHQRVRYALAVARLCREMESLRTHAQRMEHLERAKGDLLNLAAHELRGPLTVVDAYLSMIGDGACGPLETADVREVLPEVMSKLRQMNALINEMLETARLEHHTPDIVVSLADLRNIISSVAADARVRAGAKERISVELEGRPLLVTVDPDRIRIVVANLVDNALKYSPSGGTVRIRAGADPVAHVVTLTVSDAGVGIDPSDMPQLFERFGRVVTAETREIPGTGLGLYISRDLARLHGGDLVAESSPGEGSTFTLTLPIAGSRPQTTVLGGEVYSE